MDALLSSCDMQHESEMVTGTHRTESTQGSDIIHCEYYDKNTKLYCKKLYASCTRHQFGLKRKADLQDAEVRGLVALLTGRFVGVLWWREVIAG